uniref:NADH dehydrogenase subunit 3 n=1 Tax=Multinervis guangxiensis TaxID=1792637 RepID=UPI003002F6A1|nr:NADH dehydrogenase subunit 3 [Multinervis guangxiensis]
MNMTLVYLFLINMIMFMMMMMIMMMGKKSILDYQKSSPFECGFNPMSKKRLPFSIHFFLIAVIFLIFDIEIIILMPLIMSFKFSMLKMWMFSSMSIIFVLILGLYNEWIQGMLDWTK